MKILAVHDRVVPIASEIRNAFIAFREMTVSIVAVVSDVKRDGKLLVGYGFNSNGRYAQQGILRERMIARLLKAPPPALISEDGANFDPFKVWQVMMQNEKPGGHGERSVAVGTLDMAFWDLIAKVENKPLARLIAERFRGGCPDESVFVYAAGGYYYPGKGATALQDEIRAYLDLGYDTVKIKIGGASIDEDLERIETVLPLVGDGPKLAVDANARFDLQAALRYSAALGPYRLKWYEEPVDPLDYAALAEVSSDSTTPLATGENLFSLPDSLNLIRYGGLEPERDFLQVDPALSYGLVEYVRIAEMLKREGWSLRRCIPHGGHQMALHVAAGLGLGGSESYPGLFQPFGGFADGVPVENGRVRIPDAPGIGIESKSELMKLYRELD